METQMVFVETMLNSFFMSFFVAWVCATILLGAKLTLICFSRAFARVVSEETETDYIDFLLLEQELESDYLYTDYVEEYSFCEADEIEVEEEVTHFSSPMAAMDAEIEALLGFEEDERPNLWGLEDDLA